MELILLGSGEEAVLAAKSLVLEGHKVVGAGPSSLYEVLSNQAGFSEMQLVNSHDEINFDIFKNILMISYAPLISKEYLQKANFFNIHFGLLPKYRGMHPVQWGLVNGELEFGYTLHQVDSGVDSGPVFHQEVIFSTETEGYAAIKNKIAKRLEKTLGQAFLAVEAGKKPIVQDDTRASYFSKRKPEDGEIKWGSEVKDIYNLIRALEPPEMPGAFFYYKNSKIIVSKAKLVPGPTYIGPTGKVVCVRENDIFVKCRDKVISIEEIIIDGEVMPSNIVFNKVGIALC